MKTVSKLLRTLLPVFFMLAFTTNANSQFLKKLGKKAEKAAERAVERRVESETTKKTNQAMDSILEPGKNGESTKTPAPQGKSSKNNESANQGSNSSESTASSESSGPKTISVYSKFDFVPGDKLLFFDDFSDDFIGDFPAKWNTNGSGEVVSVGDSPDKWFELKPGYNIRFIPDVPKLPEEYTIEFDVLALGLDRHTSSVSVLRIMLSDDTKFKDGGNYVEAALPFCQYSPIGITMSNHINNKREIYSKVDADIRNAVLNQPHISIGVNKQRYRLWVNEKKYIDIPRIVPTGSVLSTLKFEMHSFADNKERLFIRNLKVAEGGMDLRRTLISKGKVSTNGILFDSGSANIQPQSMGIIRQISQVLLQERDMKLKIVGHTDTDGNDATNMELSKKRAEAVKSALISVYNISSDRLQADGKGESDPVGDNTTTDGKALNRRVEFIKQ